MQPRRHVHRLARPALPVAAEMYVARLPNPVAAMDVAWAAQSVVTILYVAVPALPVVAEFAVTTSKANAATTFAFPPMSVAQRPMTVLKALSAVPMPPPARSVVIMRIASQPMPAPQQAAPAASALPAHPASAPQFAARMDALNVAMLGIAILPMPALRQVAPTASATPSHPAAAPRFAARLGNSPDFA